MTLDPLRLVAKSKECHYVVRSITGTEAGDPVARSRQILLVLASPSHLGNEGWIPYSETCARTPVPVGPFLIKQQNVPV